MTLREMAQKALDVQNGSNLSGVVHSFAEITAAMRAEPHNFDTPTCNTHPVCLLFADKIFDLTGAHPGGSYADAVGFAWRDCEQLAKGA